MLRYIRYDQIFAALYDDFLKQQPLQCCADGGAADAKLICQCFLCQNSARSKLVGNN